jgi:hypothetical protein
VVEGLDDALLHPANPRVATASPTSYHERMRGMEKVLSEGVENVRHGKAGTAGQTVVGSRTQWAPPPVEASPALSGSIHPPGTMAP